MAEESTRIVHGPTFKNLLDNVTKLEKQTQKKDLSSDEKSVLAQDLLSCLLDALDMQSEAVMSQSVKEQMSLTIERIVRRFGRTGNSLRSLFGEIKEFLHLFHAC